MLRRLASSLGTWCDYKWVAPFYRLRLDLGLVILALFYEPSNDHVSWTVTWLPESMPF